jgi:eukaryotic-like serine/threonine-protein kinase
MSRAGPAGNGDSPLTQFGQILAVCDRYEAEWKAGRRPRIEDYLDEVPEPGRPALWHELLVLELVYRRLRGERPGPEEYRTR